jgi:hypothetical protein
LQTENFKALKTWKPRSKEKVRTSDGKTKKDRNIERKVKESSPPKCSDEESGKVGRDRVSRLSLEARRKKVVVATFVEKRLS